ncbi:hypothetical protein KIF59_17745 [Enterobacter cloacae subsp. cloacae]|nr:hypothetical protein [Enterobacter cloacae subsp. cloacae]
MKTPGRTEVTLARMINPILNSPPKSLPCWRCAQHRPAGSVLPVCAEVAK